jgi:DNA-binding NarL/FixJ family response regulator
MNELEHTPTRVFVINPQELVRVGMRTLLNSVPDFRIVGEAPSGAEALPLLLQHKPDIVIVDLRVQDGTGIETAKEILSPFARPTRAAVFSPTPSTDAHPSCPARLHRCPTDMSLQGTPGAENP